MRCSVLLVHLVQSDVNWSSAVVLSDRKILASRHFLQAEAKTEDGVGVSWIEKPCLLVFPSPGGFIPTHAALRAELEQLSQDPVVRTIPVNPVGDEEEDDERSCFAVFLPEKTVAAVRDKLASFEDYERDHYLTLRFVDDTDVFRQIRQKLVQRIALYRLHFNRNLTPVKSCAVTTGWPDHRSPLDKTYLISNLTVPLYQRLCEHITPSQNADMKAHLKRVSRKLYQISQQAERLNEEINKILGPPPAFLSCLPPPSDEMKIILRDLGSCIARFVPIYEDVSSREFPIDPLLFRAVSELHDAKNILTPLLLSEAEAEPLLFCRISVVLVAFTDSLCVFLEDVRICYENFGRSVRAAFGKQFPECRMILTHGRVVEKLTSDDESVLVDAVTQHGMSGSPVFVLVREKEEEEEGEDFRPMVIGQVWHGLDERGLNRVACFRRSCLEVRCADDILTLTDRLSDYPDVAEADLRKKIAFILGRGPIEYLGQDDQPKG